MAKKANGSDGQATLPGFELNPAITNFGLGPIKSIGGGKIVGEFIAASEVNDTALLTTDRWADAAAAWLVKLCGGNLYDIREKVDAAYEDHEAERRAREADAEIGYAKQRGIESGTVVEFPGAKEPQADEISGAIALHLASMGLSVPPETVEGWTAAETNNVRLWVQETMAAKESGAENPPMPECLAMKLEWLGDPQETAVDNSEATKSDSARDVEGSAIGEAVAAQKANEKQRRGNGVARA